MAIQMRKVRLDKIASSTRHLNLARDVTISEQSIAAPRAGQVIAVRLRGRKSVYNQLEDPTGRLLELDDGDVIVGVLGSRRALRGYAGVVPDKLDKGDILHLLNTGGVIGRCTSINPEVGPPREVEVLGAVLTFPVLGERIGVPADIATGAVPLRDDLPRCPPVIAVAGTCMNAGKTSAAARIIKNLAKTLGKRVAAAKVTGVSMRRDTLAMLDRGACEVLDFCDAGFPSTTAGLTPKISKGLLHRLAQSEPDCILIELGDGILGEYGVQDILRDPDLRRVIKVWVMCASDPVGAWGAQQLMTQVFELPIHVLTGPATDNEVGRAYVRDQLKIPALNAITQESEFVAEVVRGLGWGAPATS
jgi:hypothetical protein